MPSMLIRLGNLRATAETQRKHSCACCRGCEKACCGGLKKRQDFGGSNVVVFQFLGFAERVASTMVLLRCREEFFEDLASN